MKKSNEQVFEAWRNGQALTFGSMSKRVVSTDGQTIFSYDTPILKHGVGGSPVLDVFSYSRTTTRLQNDLRLLMKERGIAWSETKESIGPRKS